MQTLTTINIALNRDFTIIKQSPIQGKGLFAKNTIPKGSRIIEYKGKRVLKETLITDIVKGLTSAKYIMNLNDTCSIDGERNGNDARYVNHSCMPNCIIYFFKEIPYLYALRQIEKGEELFFDYKLGRGSTDDALTREQKITLYPCACGSAACTGTMLAN
jgi:uncharacterized protein